MLRQHAASGLFIDEGTFQPNLEASIRAAQPMLTGGGRIDVVTWPVILPSISPSLPSR